MSEDREEKVPVKNHVVRITEDNKDIMMESLIAEIDGIERKVDSLSEMGGHGERIAKENDKLMIAKDLFNKINDVMV